MLRLASTVKELILHDVRCFEGVQQGSLRPITLLVGENSTGKTTFLACYSMLHRLSSSPFSDLGIPLDFNKEPFSMGSFQNIARMNGKTDKQASIFKLGFVYTLTGNIKQSLQLIITFSEHGSVPVISSYRFQFDTDSYLELIEFEEGTKFIYPGDEIESDIPFQLARLIVDSAIQQPGMEGTSPYNELQPLIEYIQGKFLGNISNQKHERGMRNYFRAPLLGTKLIPIAPLRAKPKRTYDPVRETATPEGSHVPMLLMKLDRLDKMHQKPIKDGLSTFGRDSGLFSDIKVRQLGEQLSDPFQIQVKVQSESYANIMDVGYGVSQSLPILVEVMEAGQSENQNVFLMQQPEVHLHPRGQAELASLLIKSASNGNNNFLIETHSDFIVDRVRTSVRQGKLASEDVSILYFEPKGNAVTLHDISLDKFGNLVGAPVGYRRFFERETDQLLGFVD